MSRANEAIRSWGGFKPKPEGVTKCQARKGRKQRNHICIAFVVWHQLNELAKQMQTTMYEVEHIPLREYQKQLWRNPAYRFDRTNFA